MASVASMFPPSPDSPTRPPGKWLPRNEFNAMCADGYPSEWPGGRPGWAVIVAGPVRWCTWVDAPGVAA